MERVALIIGVVVSIISILTFFGGVFAYIRSSGRKAYAAERDFIHLKNSIAQLSKNVEELWRQNDSRLDHVDQRLLELSFKLDGRVPSGPRPGHQLGDPPQ